MNKNHTNVVLCNNIALFVARRAFRFAAVGIVSSNVRKYKIRLDQFIIRHLFLRNTVIGSSVRQRCYRRAFIKVGTRSSRYKICSVINLLIDRHREYYKTKKCIVHCDKSEMPVADLYRTIEEHVMIKERLKSLQVCVAKYYFI